MTIISSMYFISSNRFLGIWRRTHTSEHSFCINATINTLLHYNLSQSAGMCSVLEWIPIYICNNII